ncbi:MAG: hypothetical protein SV186_00300 [Candidatus Nanohaloarchaea archaeon]|nr:hypothetical protein [Candidatus Nanohaloarchaea archaeon]
MDYTVTACRRGGYNIVVDADYDEVLELLEDQDVEFLSRTPHLAVIRFDGEKLSVKPGKLVAKVEEEERAEELAASLLD